ncbi:cytochrome b5 domain-containing protein [Lacticaseibacillus kribbianus]|uniref:cytochrome b5 domain-containing protein n=1 Tax=Lacticaseibacillus kribbianus TaxID=2926292 RepID=UPI001CD7A9AD|nr:cytochrome b5 domain-containing protein [Lacticaseibacillus kribbianus]
MMTETFTKETLAKYNGVDDPKKYVAIDGVVYDLTNVPAWAGENHHGNHAGQDLSDVIVHAPHGKSVLAKLPVVGKYVG